MKTDRTEFKETWLSESPQKIQPADYYSNMVYNINDYKKTKKPKLLGNFNGFEFKRIKTKNILFYWFEKEGVVILGIELGILPQGLKVNLIGKSPEYKQKEPFASELYSLILKDSKQGIRIMSDTSLSDEGFFIWKKLYMDGHTVTVYDATNPGRSYITLHSFSDFDNFFGNTPEHANYQFILNENSSLFETRARFNLRRMRELSGMDVDDPGE